MDTSTNFENTRWTASLFDLWTIRAGGVTEAQFAFQREGSGANPTPALQSMKVRPIPIRTAKTLLERYHYLHSIPGGSKLAFGVFVGCSLRGALTLGAGPANAHRLMNQAGPQDCTTLTRLWLSDELPKNAESRVIGIVLRALRKHTDLKFIISYADPTQGHLGTIYQAAGWLYTGLSSATPLYDLGDGKPQHSRSLAHAYGTHSIHHFAEHGVNVKLVGQVPKHRYLSILDSAWRNRLVPPVLTYPKCDQESIDDSN